MALLLIHVDSASLVRVGPDGYASPGECWPLFVQMTVDAEPEVVQQAVDLARGVDPKLDLEALTEEEAMAYYAKLAPRVYVDLDSLSEAVTFDLADDGAARVAWSEVVLTLTQRLHKRLQAFAAYRAAEDQAFLRKANGASYAAGLDNTSTVLERLELPELAAEMEAELGNAKAIMAKAVEQLSAKLEAAKRATVRPSKEERVAAWNEAQPKAAAAAGKQRAKGKA